MDLGWLSGVGLFALIGIAADGNREHWKVVGV
jgi:hypothetical protein